LVGKLKDLLPVRFGDEIVCSDGVRIASGRAAMGLYFYNPFVPKKLIYWIAAARPSDYRPYPFLLQLQSDTPCGIDLLIVEQNPPKILRTRFFDSRWNWSDAFEGAAVIGREDASYGVLFDRICGAVRKVSGADFVIAGMSAPPQYEIVSPGLTKWSDVASLDMTTPLAVMEMKGTELLDYRRGFAEARSRYRFFPEPDSASLSSDRTYRVAMDASFDIMNQLINLRNRVPSPFDIIDETSFDAIRRNLF
jgi:hypothetical protein